MIDLPRQQQKYYRWERTVKVEEAETFVFDDRPEIADNERGPYRQVTDEEFEEFKRLWRPCIG
jgi:hypothetical protein